MKKSRQGYKNYTALSQNEAFLLSCISTYDHTVFRVSELHALSRWNKNRLHNILTSLIKKNVLTRIKRNIYTVTDHINENIYDIATEIIVPSYISFWTALSYYGFTEQQIRTIQLVSTKQIQDIHVNSHMIQVTTFQPREFYGYQRMNGFVIAEKEKTVIDSLFQLEKCGGLDEYVKCLRNAWEELNKKTFIRYLKLFHNRSLISRMGYLVTQLKFQNADVMESLRKEKSRCPIKLNPQRQKKGKYDKTWNVLINDTITSEGVR